MVVLGGWLDLMILEVFSNLWFYDFQLMSNFSFTSIPKSFSSLNSFTPQPVFMLGIVPTQVQDRALDYFEVYEASTGTLLQPGWHPFPLANQLTTQLDIK